MIPFTEQELRVIGQKSGAYSHSPRAPRFDTPITPKENFLRVLRHETPCWMPFRSDLQSFAPRIFPDNVVTGLVVDNEPALGVEDFGGKGWFDTQWVYVPQVGGSTTVPGQAQIADITQWKQLLTFPDIDTYDWESSARANADFFDPDRCVYITMMTAYWERLMAFMDVADGAVAMIDEDCQEDIHQLFEELTELYIHTVDHCYDAYHPQIILWHDDWGTQMGPFFSAETIREMILPYLSRLIAHVHTRGMYFELHSCGKIECMAPLMVEAGVDLWNGQPMNDKLMLAKSYGKDMIIGVLAPQIPEEMPEEEIRRMAGEFFEIYKDQRILVEDRIPNRIFEEELYRQSRLYYMIQE